MVEQPICHNCQIVLTTTFHTLTAKINETHDAWNITFSFFPLFGIFVIHLARVNGKHRRDKHSFAATNVGKLWTSILCSSLQSNWKRFADWSIFSMAFILSRGVCFHESAGIVVFVDLGIFFFSRNFWLLLLFSRIHFPYRVLKKFDFFSTGCCSGLFLAFFWQFFFSSFIPIRPITVDLPGRGCGICLV